MVWSHTKFLLEYFQSNSVMGKMKNRETIRAFLTVICGVLAISFCDKLEVVSGQGIRGVIVNNQIVENGGKVNFIYPNGYTKIKVGWVNVEEGCFSGEVS